MADPTPATAVNGLPDAVAPTWDTVWQSIPDAHGNLGFGDWPMADPTLEPANAGGLATQDPLSTAIIIQLMTDARRPDATAGGDDPGGWHGDYYDIDKDAGEGPLGSLLWTLNRGPVDYTVLRTAEHYAISALQTLVNQGAASRFEVKAEADQPNGFLKLTVRAFDAAGQSIFANTLPV